MVANPVMVNITEEETINNSFLLTLKPAMDRIWCKCSRSGEKGERPLLIRRHMVVIESKSGMAISHNTVVGVIILCSPCDA